MSIALITGGTRGIGLATAEARSNTRSPWYHMVVPAHQSSKTALNSTTIARAKQVAAPAVVVTSVCPAAAPSGTFVDSGGAVRW
jgi:NAD(P)-dependent dehydrogenase (short-subunit alcohol dehydrogenase family)